MEIACDVGAGRGQPIAHAHQLGQRATILRMSIRGERFAISLQVELGGDLFVRAPDDDE